MDILLEIGNWFSDFFVQTGNEILESLEKEGGAVQNLGKSIKDIAKEGQTPDETKTWLGLQLFDKDFWKLIFRFFMNFAILFVIIRMIYYPISKRKDYLFSYFLLSMIIFTICFTLKKFELGMGMALGLFAIFGIIRYRTDPIPIKEMTYLFIVIGVSVINALANNKMSYAELAFVNLAIVVVTFSLERVWLLKHESRKAIIYEKIDLIKPDKAAELRADLEARTGLKINRIQIGKIDFLRDTAQVFVYFYENEQSGDFIDEGISNSN
ncbi:MAG: hypothetical protein ACI9J3_000661 [Parvicellaceae bacterium]|jgi:hypothetical protein